MSFSKFTFLGTSSGVPTKYRNVSSSCLTLGNGAVWMFDCGEGTQHQLQKAAGLSSGKIDRIFLTHLHGDHCYGLPGLLCSMGMMWRPAGAAAAEESNDSEVDEATEPSFSPFSSGSEFLEIVGPPKTGNFIRGALGASEAWLPFRFRVTELGEAQEPVQLHPCEAAPRFVSRNENGLFDLNVVSGIRVVAGPLDHRVTCFGYCLTEEVTAGALDVGAASALGVPKGPMLATLKRGQSVSLSDGTVVHPAQVLGSATPGRKFVLLGDTCGSSGIAAAAMDATWLVHESTFDDDSAALAIPRGHSTARMAGEFARSINAKNLLLTHFSARFLPRSKDPQFMDKIEQQAGAGSAGTCAVRAVEDFECIELARRRK